MSKYAYLPVAMVAAFAGGPALAASSFQQTCSQIEYAYSGNNATMKAVCLRRDGSANPTSLTLQGISNNNGKLVQGSGAASFQQSCGNIHIVVAGPNEVNLTALCRTVDGASNSTSIPLNNISNHDGNLTQ
jgi:CVNH domain